MSVSITPATSDDAGALSALLIELGYDMAPEQARSGFWAIDAAGNDPVFVAVLDGTGVGLVALHTTRRLQLDKPIARTAAKRLHSIVSWGSSRHRSNSSGN